MAKKKNINDADFFDDAHLDAVGEEVEAIDPDAGADDGVVADGNESEDDADEDGVDPDADSDAGDNSGDVVADEASGDDPAPHLPDDPEVLKTAFAEVRKYANKTERENQELRAQLEQAQAAALVEYDYEEEPSYDTNQFAQIAGQDPNAAFEYALNAGNTADARAAIAQVQVDSNELAALAALAQDKGDEQGYHHYRSNAQAAQGLAQQMQGRLQGAFTQAAQAPLVAAEQKRNVQWAEQVLQQQTQGDYGQRVEQVKAVLRERPYLIAGNTADAIHRGFQDAYRIAIAEPAPTAAVTPAGVDAVVKESVDKHFAEIRAAKAKAAEAAGGAEGGRTGPTGTRTEPSLKNELYAAQAAASLGARNFMDM